MEKWETQVNQGEIASLPSYHFYMRLGALNPEEPFSGVTVPVEIEENSERVSDVVEYSTKRYARKYVEININNQIQLTKQTTKKTSSTLSDILP